MIYRAITFPTDRTENMVSPACRNLESAVTFAQKQMGQEHSLMATTIILAFDAARVYAVQSYLNANDGWEAIAAVSVERMICRVSPSELADDEDEANAAHIVHCVNTHDQLVAALEEALNRLERVDKIALDATGSVYDGPLGEITRGRAALAAAKKGVTA